MSWYYVFRKKVIYSGRKRYKILHLHSSTRNSLRNQWLRPVAQQKIWSGGAVTDVFLTVENWSNAPVKILASLFLGAHGFFGLILAAPLAAAEVKKLPLSDIPCKGDVQPDPQPRGQPDNCTTRSFQKHVWLLGASYKHFGSTWKYQLVAALRALVAGLLLKVLLANLRDAPCFWFNSIKRLILAMIHRYIGKATDCIWSLSWQGTLGNRRSLGRSSVLYSYWQSHHCSQHLWKIGKWLFGIRCGVVEMQNCAHWGCKGVGRIRNDVVAPIKQVASEVVSIYCVMHCEVLVAKKLGIEEEITNWLVLFPGFRSIYYCMVSIGVSSGFRSKLWMQSCPKKSRGFDELVIEMGGDGHFVYHSEVWWLSQ